MSILLVFILLIAIIYGTSQSFGRGDFLGKSLSLYKIEEELKKAEQEGRLSAEQSKGLMDAFEERTKRNQISLIGVISVLGALLFGLGIILFAAANWQRISREVKVAGISLLIPLFYFLGYYLAYKKQSYPIVGRIFIFLASIIYGGDLFLINNCYTIVFNEHVLILIWALGILPLSFIFEEILNPILFSTLTIVWSFMYMDAISSFNLYYILFFCVSMYLTYKFDSILLLLLNLIGIVSFYIGGIANQNAANGEALMVLVLAVLAVLIFSFGLWLGERGKSKFQYVNKICSFVLINISFFLMTFEGVSKGATAALDTTSYLVFGVTILLLFYFLWKVKNKDTILKVMLLIPLYIAVLQYAPVDLNIKTVISNIVFPIFVLWCLSYGYRKKEGYIFIIALITFLIEIIARYFDYFFKILPRSMFFILGGAILLGGAIFLERKRHIFKEEKEEEK